MYMYMYKVYGRVYTCVCNNYCTCRCKIHVLDAEIRMIIQDLQEQSLLHADLAYSHNVGT